MTYNLLAETFLLPNFSLPEQDKQIRRPDGVQSSHLYLCKSFIWGPGNRSSHHFSFTVMSDVLSLCCNLHFGSFYQVPSLSLNYWQMIYYWQVTTFTDKVNSLWFDTV